MKSKKSNNMVLASLFTALGASLCCIMPVLAVIAGISGIASSFSWLGPVRPYLIVFTILVLGFAWYQKLKPRKTNEPGCECETDTKESFWQSKKMLSTITLFAALMLAFPYYSGIFFPTDSNAQTITMKENDITEATISIEGMTCSGCEHGVNHALVNEEGVIEASSSYKNGTANVKFDGTKLKIEALKAAIEKETGYEVTAIKTKGR